MRFFRDAVSDDAARCSAAAGPRCRARCSRGAGLRSPERCSSVAGLRSREHSSSGAGSQCPARGVALRALDQDGPRTFATRDPGTREMGQRDFAPRVAAHRAETPRSRASSGAAARRSLHAGLHRRYARPVRHACVGRTTILLEIAHGACVKAFCQLSLPVESLTLLSAEPAVSPSARKFERAVVAAVKFADAGRGERRRRSTVGRLRASDLSRRRAPARDRVLTFTPQPIAEQAVAIDEGFRQRQAGPGSPGEAQ